MSRKPAMNMTLFKQTVEQIDARGEQRSVVVDRDLTRLYTMYDRVLSRLELSVAEACFVVDALREQQSADPDHIRLALDDAVRYKQLHKKHGVDGEGLMIYLTGQSSFVMLTLLDAVERYWLSPSDLRGWDNYGQRERIMKDKVAEVFGIKKGSAVTNV